MALNSFINGRWVGPQEAARLAAQKASQAAYRAKEQETINKTFAAAQLNEQNKQANYFKKMVSSLDPMFQKQTETVQSTGNLPVKINTKTPQQDVPSVPSTTAPSEIIQAPQSPTNSSSKLFGDYTQEEMKVLKKLLETYRKNPNSFANLI